MEHLTTGQLAKRAKVPVQTLRYYERLGLIPRPPRRESGYRQYPPDTVARILFIKRAKELGFSLKEVSELLSLRIDRHTTCRDVKSRTEAKIVDIEGRIRTLQGMRKALAQLSAACRGRGPTSECPILDALQGRKDE